MVDLSSHESNRLIPYAPHFNNMEYISGKRPHHRRLYSYQNHVEELNHAIRYTKHINFCLPQHRSYESLFKRIVLCSTLWN